MTLECIYVRWQRISLWTVDAGTTAHETRRRFTCSSTTGLLLASPFWGCNSTTKTGRALRLRPEEELVVVVFCMAYAGAVVVPRLGAWRRFPFVLPWTATTVNHTSAQANASTPTRTPTNNSAYLHVTAQWRSQYRAPTLTTPADTSS